MQLQNYLQQCQERVNHTLDDVLPSSGKNPCELHKAMRYAVLNGGKRVRSAIVYAVGESLDANKDILDISSAVIELIHAFSLVHDDLPAIDNDDLRRGNPACHKAFSEATAILAGDALLVLAFEVLSHLTKHHVTSATNLKMIQILSHYIGSNGMAGGEALDAATADHEISLKKLAQIYKLKTSYLICASVLFGALAANCTKKSTLENLEKFGIYIGLAFQIHDDIIGIESDTATLGKPQGSDLIKHKPTYPSIIGLEAAKKRQQECFTTAMHYLKKSRINSDKLVALSELVITRSS